QEDQLVRRCGEGRSAQGGGRQARRSEEGGREGLMPSERDLRRRSRSIKNIQQLTRAMQLVAASKMRRAQEAVLACRPFEEKLRSVLNDLAPYADPELSPLLARREVKKVAVVLITTDRGLVGPMNVNLVRATTRFLR